jgi:hypothetical protein
MNPWRGHSIILFQSVDQGPALHPCRTVSFGNSRRRLLIAAILQPAFCSCQVATCPGWPSSWRSTGMEVAVMRATEAAQMACGESEARPRPCRERAAMLPHDCHGAHAHAHVCPQGELRPLQSTTPTTCAKPQIRVRWLAPGSVQLWIVWPLRATWILVRQAVIQISHDQQQ